MSIHINYLLLTISLTLVITAFAFNQEQPVRPKLRNFRTSRAQTGAGSAVEVAPPANIQAPAPAPRTSAASSNRTTRTADVFQNGDGYNIFVTNTCERESMNVNIKTSRPFYGVIHTSNSRKRPGCTVEGDGSDEYNLVINHVLNQNDSAFCGVVRARKESPEDKDILSVVVAVRLHRNIELSDDKFFLLNCTNRCRRPDCAKPNQNYELTPDPNAVDNNGSNEREETSRGNGSTIEECTIWRFPWIITLLWCLGILLLAMIISHCIMCSSLVCRCVKTEIEEKEPSIYEGATDYDDDDQYNKRHPYRIDYDNRDIYKTSNNYEPYCLEETQTKSRHKTRPKK